MRDLLLLILLIIALEILKLANLIGVCLLKIKVLNHCVLRVLESLCISLALSLSDGFLLVLLLLIGVGLV